MPSLAELLNTAVAHHRRAEWAAAEALYREALELRPGNVDATHLLGLVLHQTGRHAEGVQWLSQAIALDDKQAAFHRHLAAALVALEEYAAAIDSLQRSIELVDDASGRQLLASLCVRQGQTAEGIVHLRQAIHLDPMQARAHLNLGRLLGVSNQLTAAADCFRNALAGQPELIEARVELATIESRLGNHPAAEAHWLAITLQRPSDANAHFRLGNSRLAQFHFFAAEKSFRSALSLDAANAEIQCQLATTLHLDGRYEQALVEYRAMSGESTRHRHYLQNYGTLSLLLGNRETAGDCFDKILAESPEDPEIRFVRGAMRVADGDFLHGWPDLDYRAMRAGGSPRTFEAPRWRGEPIPGGRLLTYGEFGLGDILQFIRYLPLLTSRSQAGTIWIEVNPPLIPLLEQSGFTNVVPYGEAPGELDAEVPLMSLPAVFGTELHSIPVSIPYLKADRLRVSNWSERLAAIQGFKVGIHWQGSKRADKHRSFPLAAFEPVARVPGVTLISLQKNEGVEQIAEQRERFSMLVFDALDEGAGAFLDTAAILHSLDLVITSDSALAHLAGGLGIRTWLALPSSADWRWLLDREDCPWYPTLRLWRQSRLDDWSELFIRIALALASEVGQT